MRNVLTGFTMVMLLATSASTQAPKTTSDPNQAFFLPAADIAATVAKLQKVAYANNTVLERADGEALGYRLAVDKRTPPQRGASHATEAELWAIIDGNGVITTGGTIVETKKDGKVVDRHSKAVYSTKLPRVTFLSSPRACRTGDWFSRRSRCDAGDSATRKDTVTKRSRSRFSVLAARFEFRFGSCSGAASGGAIRRGGSRLRRDRPSGRLVIRRGGGPKGPPRFMESEDAMSKRPARITAAARLERRWPRGRSCGRRRM